MKSFVMLFFVVGIVMLAIGYQNKVITNTKPKVRPSGHKGNFQRVGGWVGVWVGGWVRG